MPYSNSAWLPVSTAVCTASLNMAALPVSVAAVEFTTGSLFDGRNDSLNATLEWRPSRYLFASILIGCVLAAVAALLAYETKGLLIGEAADPEAIARVRRIVGAEQGVQRINELLTMHMGPRDVLLNLSIDFRDGLSAEQVEAQVTDLERRIKAAVPEITRVFIEAQDRRGHRRGR